MQGSLCISVLTNYSVVIAFDVYSRATFLISDEILKCNFSSYARAAGVYISAIISCERLNHFHYFIEHSDALFEGCFTYWHIPTLAICWK